MAVSDLKTVEEVIRFINDCENLTLVYLYTKWALECKHLTAVYDALASESDNKYVRFGMVDAEDVQKFCIENKVSSVPVVLFFKNRVEVARVQGANAVELTNKVISLRSAPEDLNNRLRALINQAPIMLFMKGTPEGAQCKFSRKLLEILHKYNVKFGSFNILSDDSVREGLKKYSNWPTYPQLYVKGELIGGVDVVRQMDEAGELASALKL